MSFTGTFHHAIDDKGRLIVPSKLRYELVDDQVVLTKWMGDCVAMWSGDGWKRMEQSLLELGRSSAAARQLVRVVAASAHQDGVDKQGRVSVPEDLRRFAGIDNQCVVTGALDHAELWSPDRWNGVETEVAESGGLDELASRLSF